MEWRDIENYKGFYQVSDEGCVRSLDRTIVTREGVLRPLRGRVMKIHLLYRGHRGICFHRDGISKRMLVHRLVLTAFVGPCPDGMECRHLDGNPGNNHLENLKWGTRLENCADRTLHGCDGRKLTDTQALKIRALYSTGRHKQTSIAEMYGVSGPTVSGIVTRKRYNHL